MKQKHTSEIRSKITAIAALACLAGGLLWYAANHHSTGIAENQEAQPATRPLPELSTAAKRRESYEPERGDIKYRVVAKPSITPDAKTGWNMYASSEYKFSFAFPPEVKWESTESLGYQLPPDQAYKGSRDTLQIVLHNKRSAFFILHMNIRDEVLPPATTTSETIRTVNGTAMKKKILQSMEQKFANTEIITYSFEKNSKLFFWYGAFDAQDVQSINEYESVVGSMVFPK